jgi:membrane-associated phospholipid phosphatase
MNRRTTLLTAVTCAVAFTVLYVVAVHTAPGRGIDEWVRLRIVVGLDPLEPLGAFLRSTFPRLLAAFVLLLALVALWRRRWRSLVVATAVVGVSTAIAYLLRNVLLRTDFGTGLSGGADVNTFPSTHVAATASLLVAAIVLWPRPLVGASSGAAWVVAGVVLAAAALGSVVTHAHRPSDVVGSVLLVAGVTAATWAVTARVDHPAQRR